MNAPMRDPAFESLLQSTQALAKNIRQSHEQQQGPISPMSLANFPPQPPTMHDPLGVPYLQEQLMQRHLESQPPGPPPNWQIQMGSRSYDSQVRNVSIDSDMAYDGIEELLMDSFLDESKMAAAAAANAHQIPMYSGQMPPHLQHVRH